MGWRAHIDTNAAFMRRNIHILIVNQFQDGSMEYVTDWSENPTMYRVVNSNGMASPDDPGPTPIVLNEEAARAVMEELQRHFGAYAGVDYERLRKDYDRVVTELTKANDFIRQKFDDILVARRVRPRSE